MTRSLTLREEISFNLKKPAYNSKDIATSLQTVKSLFSGLILGIARVKCITKKKKPFLAVGLATFLFAPSAMDLAKEFNSHRVWYSGQFTDPFQSNKTSF